MNRSRTSRRSFLKYSARTVAATVGTGYWSQHVAAESRSPNEKLNIAFIGTDGQAVYHLAALASLGHNCPCFCDVDTVRMARAAAAWPKAARYQDYRRMLDKHQREIDAVYVTVPDHHHYPASMMAIQLGKHVHCEKPLTHSIWEARQLTLAARQQRVATQMGIQGHAMSKWRELITMIRAGHIGKVREVHSWSDRPIWPQGIARPAEMPTVPATLDWDVWLGPAPQRPYHEVYHPFNWRGWHDFGTGALGDMACHQLDGMFWLLDPAPPTSVEVVASSVQNDETYPVQSVIRWRYPAKGSEPEFTVYWYDGGLLPSRPPELDADHELPKMGCYFVGDRGTLISADWFGDQPQFLPLARMKEIKMPAELAIPASPGHHEEFVAACKGGPPAGANFDYAGPMTEAILLGNLALRVGKPIRWDATNLRAVDVPEADRFIRREYRKGWDV
jgi:predicted dehydrogenase